MRPITRTVLAGAAVAGGVAGGVAAARATARRRASGGEGRWHSITVFRPLTEVGASLPDELTSLDLRLREAPGGRGTEVHARAGEHRVPDGEIRRILRETRSRIETGEVLRPGGPTTEPTLFNRPLRAATRRGRTGGLL